MSFRIKALPFAPFAPLFELADRDLAARGILRRIADTSPGFPCRVSLRDADVGETVLLLNHEHLPAPGPYRSRHAIYVREAAVECTPGINEIPPAFRIRLLSVRAFDAEAMMLNADVVDGANVELAIDLCFEDRRVVYLHLHHARPGCFAARVDRA